MKTIQIGITGGIGSGKSIVSQILRIMQYPVYDTDREAKRLMNTPEIKEKLMAAWGNEIFDDKGSLDRKKLADIVFSAPDQLSRLNNIVHPAVRNDYTRWAKNQSTQIVFVESAILQQAGMDVALDYVWVVEADRETRIKRVMHRNNMNRRQVEERMANQPIYKGDNRTRKISNNENEAVLPQIIKLLNNLNNR